MAAGVRTPALRFDFRGIAASSLRAMTALRRHATSRDLPDRQKNRRARKPVHPCARKYSASRLPQIKLTTLASRTHKRGASRSSRTLGAGCDGRTSPSAILARTNGVCADGEVVWSWRSDAGAKVAGLNESDDRRWQPSMVTEESTKDTVKTIAQGRPDGGFKRSSQHQLFSLMTATRQLLPLAFSSPVSFSVGH